MRRMWEGGGRGGGNVIEQGLMRKDRSELELLAEARKAREMVGSGDVGLL